MYTIKPLKLNRFVHVEVPSRTSLFQRMRIQDIQVPHYNDKPASGYVDSSMIRKTDLAQVNLTNLNSDSSVEKTEE